MRPEFHSPSSQPTGFADHADRLVVRLYPPRGLPDIPDDHFVHRADLPELVTMLAIDLGPSVTPVPKTVADAWGMPAADLFDRALANIARASRVRWTKMSVPTRPPFTFDLLHGDGHAAAHALRAGRSLPRIGKHGNLVAMPACNVLLSTALDGAFTGPELETLLDMARGRFEAGPDSITPNLYWRSPAGQWEVQLAVRDGERTRLAPSDGFVECLVRMHRAQPR